MMTELRIHNFRTFRELKVGGLTRVSLLVGANNAGKTSVLDAAELVLGGASPSVLTRSLARRGESGVFKSKRDDIGVFREYFSVEHLFHGRQLRANSEFRIEAEARGRRYFSVRVVELSEDERSSLGVSIEPPSFESALGLELSGDRLQPGPRLPLDEAGHLSSFPSRPRKTLDSSEAGWTIRFLGTAPPHIEQISALWDQVVLKPEEERVTSTLQIIEPSIDRIAALTSIRSPGGFFVKLKGSEQRTPLGSMGEGIKRLLVLSLNLVNSAGGYLLVDEIDTGLHHSVMVKMWQLVVEAARRLNAQVLATTHSLDCVHALAELYEQHPEMRDDISLHRIERGAEASIRHSADELLAAARHQMEVR